MLVYQLSIDLDPPPLLHIVYHIPMHVALVNALGLRNAVAESGN
jgi:hypothetical protein